MRIKYEEYLEELSVDFTDKGSNFEVFMVECTDEQYREYMNSIVELDMELEDMELKDAVEVLIYCVSKYNW